MSKSIGTGKVKAQKAAEVKETDVVEQMSDEDIAIKIVHILSIYPILSPTMLQSGLGPYMKPAMWRPVLEALLEEGRVIEEQQSMQTPHNRYNTYTKLSLPGTTVMVTPRAKRA